jgi:cyclic pyranopterin phosphate synthase
METHSQEKPVPVSPALSHVDGSGKARMVDVSAKPRVRRSATASGRIDLAPATLELIAKNAMAKGDVLATARIAGIMAAKRTAELIPLCHNIEIEHVHIELEPDSSGIAIRARAVCTDKTGIEMEALTAVSVAALTIYDMCKAVDKGMRIGSICLEEKTKELLP